MYKSMKNIERGSNIHVTVLITELHVSLALQRVNILQEGALGHLTRAQMKLFVLLVNCLDNACCQ